MVLPKRRIGLLMAATLAVSTTTMGQLSWEAGAFEKCGGIAKHAFRAIQLSPRDNPDAGRRLNFLGLPGGSGLSFSKPAPTGSWCDLTSDGGGGSEVKPLTNDVVVELAKAEPVQGTPVAIAPERKTPMLSTPSQETAPVSTPAPVTPESNKPKPSPGFFAGFKNGPPPKYWIVQGIMFSSVVAGVETTQSCINGGSCTAIPSALRTRGAMYALALPVAAGAAYLNYRVIKKHQNHWWYVPPLVIAAASTALTIHSAGTIH